MEDGDRGVLSTGITAFHAQLVSDALWVVFHLLLAGVDPVFVGPRACKIWGRKASLKSGLKVGICLG